VSIHTPKIDRKVTVRTIASMKGREPIVMITAYDALFASIFDAKAEIILVGDSLNMSFLGEKDTLGTTLDQMIYHTRAVCNGSSLSMVVLDMPFGSYMTPDQALENAVRVYRETCADAVKIEGGAERAETVARLTSNGIAVVSHIGLMPQFVRSEGGYRVRGRSEEDIETLIEDAKALEEAGAFMIILEGMKSEAAERITREVSIPTVGIGAGPDTDGQVLVWSDMFGFFREFKPRFVKRYMDGADMVGEALDSYISEVKSGKFPDEKHCY